MKRIIVLTCFLLATLITQAQFDPMYSQYMRNMMLINPAYAGSYDFASATLVHRAQWVGFKGAPTTSAFSIHSPLPGMPGLGVGATVMYDKIGPLSESAIVLNGAYHLKLNDQLKISGGLSGTINNLRLGLSDLNPVESNDVVYNGTVNSFLPNIGAGFLLYSHKGYLGLGLPRALESRISNGQAVLTNLGRKQRSYFVNVGYVFDINTYWKFKPTATVRLSEGIPINAEVTANMIYKNVFSFGAMYRYTESIGVNVFVQANKKFSLGYAFDFPLWGGFAYSYGSHELMLKYDFLHKKAEVVDPRHF